MWNPRMKWQIIIILMVLTACFCFAETTTCEDVLEVGENCTMITPSLTCSTYNYTILNNTGGIVHENNLSILNGSIYKFNFNWSQEEKEYIIQLCDYSTREIYVKYGDTMQLAIIIGLCFVSFILLYFAFNIDKEHFLLKLLLIFFGLATLILIPASLINGWKVTSVTFLKGVMWLFGIFCTYFFVYLSYHWFIKSSVYRKFGGGNNNDS